MSNEQNTESSQGATDAASKPTDNSDHPVGVKGKTKTFITSGIGMLSGLGNSARLVFVIGATILGALLLLWLVDKVVFYYVARSYVDEVASALDLNVHLANALVLLTFIIAVFFARYIWSFSRQKRLIGIVGISALLIGHSLVLWYGTRDKPFDRQGNAIKCYVLSRDGQVTYGERPGVDPATGRQCRPVTAEMFERLQKYAAGKRPQMIAENNPIFFDPRSGEPIVWYYSGKDNNIEIFDLMGFHPDTGQELLPITKEVAEQWKKQSGERSRRVPKLITDLDKYVFFDPLNGQARAWYWLGENGRYQFYDSPGFQPQTGDKLQLVTRDIINEWKDKQNNPTTASRPPNRVQIASDTVFFDPVSPEVHGCGIGAATRATTNSSMGPVFTRTSGQPLQSFTKDALAQYQQEIAEKAKQLKAEQDRIEAEQKARQEAEARKQAEQKRRADEDEHRRAEETERQTAAARKCDELAANPNDARRVAQGASYADLKPMAAEAVDACEMAAKQNPNELRLQYQLGRALELMGDGPVRVKNRQRALEIHQALVKQGYAAAFDNLASLYRWDRKDLTTAVVVWRKGVELSDSDSMVSLADLVEKSLVMPQGPNETPLELYKRAADLGNENGIRAYQSQLANAQQMQEQQIQRLQQQRMMLQFMGNVLQNIPAMTRSPLH